MKHKKRHLSGERVNHNVFFDKLIPFCCDEFAIVIGKDFFSRFYVYQNTQELQKYKSH